MGLGTGGEYRSTAPRRATTWPTTLRAALLTFRSVTRARDPRLRSLPVAFYRRDTAAVARELLGRYLVRRLDVGGRRRRLVVRIVETEAYLGAPDRASHAWDGRRTARNESLYRAGGYAYVYFIYGMHYCVNAVTGAPGIGSAVLIRAGEPVEGAAVMEDHRSLARPPRPGDLAGGPGKLCHALAIDRALDGAPLYRGALRIAVGEPVAGTDIVAGPRIGVDYAGEAARWPLRFAPRGNPHVSRPRL